MSRQPEKKREANRIPFLLREQSRDQVKAHPYLESAYDRQTAQDIRCQELALRGVTVSYWPSLCFPAMKPFPTAPFQVLCPEGTFVAFHD